MMSQIFLKIIGVFNGALKNFASFTGKHLSGYNMK